MRDLDALLTALARSKFSCRLPPLGCELAYRRSRGIEKVLEHARDVIDKRLAPAMPANDGKQTPFRNHPVFVAQHATATCCRGCLEKWHRIPKGNELTAAQRAYIVGVIERWL